MNAPLCQPPALVLTADELDAVTEILGRTIEPHSCEEGTAWRPAFTAWEKCATARGTLEAENDA